MPASAAPLTLVPGAVVDLPPGMLATIVSYLDIAPQPADPPPARPGLALQPLRGAEVARYRALYRRLGERWLWWSRLASSEAGLAAILDDPAVAAQALTQDGADIGLVELDFRGGDEAELAFFGLVEGAIGQGLGRWLMQAALARAFAQPVRRLIVHTCTFDHPGALDFYRRSGFRLYRQAIEYVRDPRLDGLLSRAAAPHVPLVEG